MRTKHRTFSIPFRIPKSEDPDADAAPTKVVLEASKDLGATWQPAGESAPTATAITYQAGADGEYWFRLRAVDRKGRARGGEGPDLRVLVDAAGPRLAGRVWKGADGEIICRYAAADGSLSLESLKVEYRAAGDTGWKPIAAQAVLARESPAHLVGEEIWWAGEKVTALTVRVTVADSSGNQTVKQFSLEPQDPQVDQTALAREIDVPPLPLQESTTAASVPAAPSSPAPSTTGGWAAESAGTWSDGQPPAASSSAQPPAAGRSVLVRPTTAATTVASRPAVTPGSLGTADIAASPSAGGGLEYRGRPLQLSRARRFAWDYAPPPDGAGLRAELWTTQDGGVTWQRTAVDGDGRSPIDVALPAAGLYGARLEFAGAGDEPTGPRSGTAPDVWVGVDEEPPQAELVSVARDDAAPTPTLVIHYAVHDPLISPHSVRILYSLNAAGPWATIRDGADNQGEHRWTPDRTVPASVFIRIEATDAAGNVGFATSAEPVTTAVPRPGGRLGGLRPLPTAP
ncbi:MAG: hypothetical protein ACKOC8_04505 [Pirellulales bacterium]